MHSARGACAITLAADLQDPPAIIPKMIAKWREGAQIVAGVRVTRAGESLGVRVFSRLYRGMMRRILAGSDGVQEITGYCLLDRKVIDASRVFPETNSNSLALLQWMGFRTAQVEYDQEARVHGRSNWTFGRKVKLMVDSITAFSGAPIRLMIYAGFLVFLLGIGTAVFAAGSAGPRQESSQWLIILAAVLLLGGIQMSMMGILGEYLWRTLVDARRRPQYLIEDTVGFPAGVARQTN
jgi:dolichol-phosphate mannosyltransferase